MTSLLRTAPSGSLITFFFFSSRRRHTRWNCDWSSDVCSSDLYTLDQDPMKKVTLRQELEALDLYLGTERLRFGERLRLEYAIEPDALEGLVPSLLLQPLLENSLKYAVSAREQGGVVRIEGRTREGWLELAVIDDGPGLREGTPSGDRRG